MRVILLVMIITVLTLQVMLQTMLVKCLKVQNSINLKKSIHESSIGENLEIKSEFCILYCVCL